LWRDELRAGLRPERVVALRYRRGIGRRLAAKSVLRIESAGRAAPWEAAVEALGKLLAPKVDLTAVLSSHFARYAVLPWNRSLASRQEWQAYARHAFVQTYGAAASAWDITLCATGAKKPRLACAVDRALIESLDHAARSAGARLVSVQPYLAAAFNRLRASIADANAWLALHEDDRITLASIGGGAWRAVRSRRLEGAWPHALPELIGREALVGTEPARAQRLYVVSEDEGARELKSAHDLTLAAGEPRELRAYAMALA
jgi:hypothetical protein